MYPSHQDLYFQAEAYRRQMEQQLRYQQPHFPAYPPPPF